MGGLFTVLYSIWMFCNCTISNLVYVTFHYLLNYYLSGSILLLVHLLSPHCD